MIFFLEEITVGADQLFNSPSGQSVVLNVFLSWFPLHRFPCDI